MFKHGMRAREKCGAQTHGTFCESHTPEAMEKSYIALQRKRDNNEYMTTEEFNEYMEFLEMHEDRQRKRRTRHNRYKTPAEIRAMYGEPLPEGW